MTIAGDHPERGVRVALELLGADDRVARYGGSAFTPLARHPLDLAVDVATGAATVHVALAVPASSPIQADAGEPRPPSSEPPPSLEAVDVAFVRQLGKQLWRLATQTAPEHGGGQWPRRVQRWRAPRG